MTDNDIKKALECCKSRECTECTRLYNALTEEHECRLDLMEKVYDLINRLQAENERLRKAGEEAVSCFTRMESLYKIKCKELEVAKSEAIKEFAERLKDLTVYGTIREYEIANGLTYILDDMVREDIDNLVKEMTEQSVNYGSSKTEE